MLQFKFVGIILTVVIIICLAIFFFIFGAPWEHMIAEKNVREYVIKEHSLTPTHVNSRILLDYSVAVGVKTKEKDFSFDVYVSRKNLNNVVDDEYLKSMAEYKLAKYLEDYVKLFFEEKHRVIVTIGGGINNTGLTEKEIDTDINTIFDKLKGKNSYSCGFLFDDYIVERNDEIDYEKILNICNYLRDNNYDPYRAYFSFYSTKKNDSELILRVNVYRNELVTFKNAEDIETYFEKEMEKQQKEFEKEME